MKVREIISFQKLPFFLAPLDGERARLEPLTVRELFVLPELRLDAVRRVVAQLDEIAVVSVQELEEPLSGLPLPRRPGRSVRVIEGVVAHTRTPYREP
jgi:hypothetical protein